MPDHESELGRYGELLDAAGSEPVGATPSPGAGHRRGMRAALVAVAVVLVVSLIAVAAVTRSSRHTPAVTTPTTAPPAPTRTTTTTSTPTTTTSTPATTPLTGDQAIGAAWVHAHGGHVVVVSSPVAAAISDRAYYVMSADYPASRTSALSRIDRRTLSVSSIPIIRPVALAAIGNAVYVVLDTGSSAYRLERLDPDSLRPIWSAQLSGDDGGGTPGLAVGNDSLWVSIANRLEQFDAQSGRAEHSIPFSIGGSSVGAEIALDPTGHVLYVAYGDGGGGAAPIEIRNAGTGARVAFNAHGPGSVGQPQIAGGTSGAWVAFRTGMEGGASLYPASNLAASPTDLTVDGTTGFGMGVSLTVSGRTLWITNFDFVACADATTGHVLGELHGAAGQQRNLDAGPVAADARNVLLGVDGVLGVFSPSDLCPRAN